MPNINPALGLYINNPTNMGHFGNMSTVKINTGVIATNYQVYNIFDLAGNMAEFTAETGTTTTNRIIRGGTNSAFKGSPAGVWTRSEMPDFDPMGLNSYRVALYIK